MLRTETPSLTPSRTLTVVDWAQDLERWIVSARVGHDWTLVGLFEQAHQAFRAADRASSTFSVVTPMLGDQGDATAGQPAPGSAN